MRGKYTGTTMPLTPMASALTGYLRYDYDAEEAEGEVFIKWIPNFSTLIKAIEPWQYFDRSRLVTIGIWRLQVREIAHRIEQVERALPSIQKVMPAPSTLETLYHIVLEKTIKYLKYNRDWITQYIADHIGSSLGSGYNWSQAYEVDQYDWQVVLNHLQAMYEYLNSHPGTYLNIPYNIGLRARSPALTSFDTHQTFQLTRSRIITFHPALSTTTAFIPQKAAWYKEVLDEAYKELHASVDVAYPYVQGGGIYVTAQQNFKAQPQFQAGDGTAWEAMTANILGQSFNPFWMQVGPLQVLPSGITFTSMLGTLASLVVNRNLRGKLIALGDDMNYWGPESLNRVYSEVSPEDSRNGYILGVASGPIINGQRQHVDAPRIMGIRVEIDRGDKRKPLALPPGGDITPLAEDRNYNAQMIALYVGLYNGAFGDRTLLDAVQKITPDSFKSPREYFEESILSDEAGQSIDAFAWAETHGYKKIITVPVQPGGTRPKP